MWADRPLRCRARSCTRGSGALQFQGGQSSSARSAPRFLPGSAGVFQGSEHLLLGGLWRPKQPPDQSSVFAPAVWFVGSALQPLSYRLRRESKSEGGPSVVSAGGASPIASAWEFSTGDFAAFFLLQRPGIHPLTSVTTWTTCTSPVAVEQLSGGFSVGWLHGESRCCSVARVGGWQLQGKAAWLKYWEGEGRAGLGGRTALSPSPWHFLGGDVCSSWVPRVTYKELTNL